MNRVKDGLFHREVSWDRRFSRMTLNRLNSVVKIAVSNHYMKQVRFRKIPKIPQLLELEHGYILEVKIENGKLVKAVIRCRHSHSRDITSVVAFTDDNTMCYVSGWCNSHSDMHKTLNVTKYNKLQTV